MKLKSAKTYGASKNAWAHAHKIRETQNAAEKNIYDRLLNGIWKAKHLVCIRNDTWIFNECVNQSSKPNDVCFFLFILLNFQVREMIRMIDYCVFSVSFSFSVHCSKIDIDCLMRSQRLTRIERKIEAPIFVMKLKIRRQQQNKSVGQIELKQKQWNTWNESTFEM